MREHDVARDEWDAATLRTPSPAVAFSPAAHTERGIIYPNARCPVCMERVYFFKASNGGRVFFDTLWPDWDKHPCTISETSELTDATPIPGEAETEAGVVLEIEVYVRPEGAILAVSNEEGHREYWSGNMDLSRRYFPQAWLTMKQDSLTGTLTVLAEDTAPVDVSIARASSPRPVTDQIRVKLSSEMKAGLIRTAKRVAGMSKSFLQTKSGYGTFVTGFVGDSRVIIIPIPADHVRWDFSTFDIISEYMAKAAANVLDSLDESQAFKSKRCMQDHAIFAFDDPFGYVQAGMANEVFAKSDGTISNDAFNYDGSRTLEKAGLKNLRWVDMAHADPIGLAETPATVADVITREDAFCDSRWPNTVAGRWRQIERFTELVGVAGPFNAAHHALRDAGWALDHPHGIFGDYFEVIYHPTGTSGSQSQKWVSARAFLSLSNAEDGMCFMVDPHDGDVDAQLKLSWVKNASDALHLVRRLKKGV
ncbi:hypothetical protein [Tardiphaga sp. 841_E9_N1_2]|uniref:hypothetical protein n=1 Tax=Tardiphaga sp. 841_E9_N1_2 TaxID=3240762 RepID=UPI003F26B47E